MWVFSCGGVFFEDLLVLTPSLNTLSLLFQVESLSDVLTIQIRNNASDVEDGGSTGKGPQLNGGCGAEWVQKKRLPPASKKVVKTRCIPFEPD